MLKVHFDAVRGFAVPDGMAESFVDDVINTRNKNAGDYELIIGNDSVVTQFRLAVANNKIPHNELVFVCNNEEIPVNQYGDLRFWPTGFADQTVGAMIKLLNTNRTKD